LIRGRDGPLHQGKLPQAARPAYSTLQGWALGTLIEQGAVKECERHASIALIPSLEPGSRRGLVESLSWRYP
jgi:hypothetical protein